MRLVLHATSAPQHEMGYDTESEPSPALLLVHDQGVYLMSNGIPRDRPAEGETAHVVYAAGCDPNVGEFDDWYNQSRELVGGDDFIEVLSLGATPDDRRTFLYNCAAFEEFVVDISPTQIDATFQSPRTRAEQRVLQLRERLEAL